ncbi:NAD(P)H-dependent flavin oxidoreductase [Corallococcus exiguus]|uniref:NAD(P)H-dependent flavin oxidoreductase n=1 Tax=Corallococcus exiguus TaxID=83462 RepID=UPI0020B7084D|nr:nitronate monooxygenase [Corallococcus exiguus]
MKARYVSTLSGDAMNGANDGRPGQPSASSEDEASLADGESDAAGLEARPKSKPIYVLEGNTLRTRLTRELGIHYPFVGAGMAFVSLPPLVVAVSEAGGLGMLGTAPEPPGVLEARLKAIQAGTQRPYGVDFIVDRLEPQGFTTRDHMDTCIAAKVPVVVFHWALPPREWIQALQAAGTRVWVQAGTVELARQALDAGVQGLIAQGRQAGGRNLGSTPTLVLLKEFRKLTDAVPVLAAGGIADGVSAARALHHGADGVWVGTRLVASVEAYAHPLYKERLVDGDAGDTALTTLFGPEWPGKRMRVIRNRVVREWAGRESSVPPTAESDAIGTTRLFPGVLDVQYVMPKFSSFLPTPDTQGDLEEMSLPAGGASMARIDTVQPAGQIVVEMMERARRLLESPEGLDEADEEDRG